ncbi:hypothetical protein [Microbacterium terricola]|uniref:hypothetical protein n=1 Tax=Microbacterium terricola TaxID=344163 RepID=UPI0021E97F0A|nr:hypothetical protein [Microbacterium terricola]UYK40765.1 hypothetical protein OAU46_03695 [Microbacterium terricola]
MRHAEVGELRRLMLTRDELLSAGRTAREIAADVRAGALHRVRRGWYMLGDHWRELWPESRHRALVVAVDADAGGVLGADRDAWTAGERRPVFCLFSAASLLGLPLYRVEPRRAHVLVSDADRRSAPDVFRHEGAIADADVTEVDGIRCTSIDRTVFDMARLAAPEVALTCADAALGRIGGDPRSYDEAAAAEWLSGMRERAGVRRVRGIRQARAIFELADGRSQLPLESVTKLQLWRLGFRRLGLQIPVVGPNRGRYWMDIEIEEERIYYECDGETKYTDESLRSGRTLEQVLLDEKRREDWVRGTTDHRVLRGGSAHAASADALAARLASFGVAVPSRRAHPFLPTRPLNYGA